MNLFSRRGTWVIPDELTMETFCSVENWITTVERRWEDFIMYVQNLLLQVPALLGIKENLTLKKTKCGFF